MEEVGSVAGAADVDAVSWEVEEGGTAGLWHYFHYLCSGKMKCYCNLNNK